MAHLNFPREPQLCPCGYLGESCDILDPGISTADNAMSTLCDPLGYLKCHTWEDQATCVCRCGYMGELCDERIEPILEAFVGGFVFVLLVTILMSKSLLLSFEHRSEEFNKPVEHFVTSHRNFVKPIHIFMFRLFCALLYIPVTMGAFSIGGKNIFATFTYMNWTFFFIMFCLGSFISYKYLINKEKAVAGYLENIYWIMLEIEFPATLLIFVVVWTILLPASLKLGMSQLVLNWRSYVVHGFNCILLFIEFNMNKLKIRLEHIKFLIIWGGLYGLFHTGLMLYYYLTDKGHCPVYPFLEMTQEYYTFSLFALMAAMVLFYYIAHKMVDKLK